MFLIYEKIKTKVYSIYTLLYVQPFLDEESDSDEEKVRKKTLISGMRNDKLQIMAVD